MADFKIAFNKVIKAEGGYVNDKDDRGGETYLGISRVHHPKSEMWEIIDARKRMKPGISNRELTKILKDIPALDRIVMDIYRNDYWNEVKLDEVPSQKISEQIFDMSVNAGKGNGIKCAQRVLGLKDDGKFTDELYNKLISYG